MASTRPGATLRNLLYPGTPREVEGHTPPSVPPQAPLYPAGNIDSGSYHAASMSAPYSPRHVSKHPTLPARAVRFASQRCYRNYSPPPSSQTETPADTPEPPSPLLAPERLFDLPGPATSLSRQFARAGQSLRAPVTGPTSKERSISLSRAPHRSLSSLSLSSPRLSQDKYATSHALEGRSVGRSDVVRGVVPVGMAGMSSFGVSGPGEKQHGSSPRAGSRGATMSSFTSPAQSAPEAAVGSKEQQGVVDTPGNESAFAFSRAASRGFFVSDYENQQSSSDAFQCGDVPRTGAQHGPSEASGLYTPQDRLPQEAQIRGSQLSSGRTETLQERQERLQREMDALRQRQQLVTQQARQLYQQKMARPWLVPCNVSPDSTRLATLAIIPSKESRKGSCERSGSCPIFSRCARSGRRRSSGSRVRRIGVYVRPTAPSGQTVPPPAPGASFETNAATVPGWFWENPGLLQCVAPVEVSCSDGKGGGVRSHPLVLKVDVVPSQTGSSLGKKEEDWKKSQASLVSSASASETPKTDPRIVELAKENDTLRQDNALLKAQLERAHAEGVRRRLTNIDLSRRSQVDVYGEDGLLWGQEVENEKLRRQIAELGAALYAAAEDGDFRLAAEALTQQLTDAHQEIATLRKSMRSDSSGRQGPRCRDTSDDATLGANDISVREAAVDSLISQGKRVTTLGRENVWKALSSMKDLVDQVFDRMTRLLTSTCTMKEKVQYLKGLHVLVVSSLDETLDAYEELAATCNKFDQIRAVVFDPKRNSPYCPCRPRRQVLEDDLKHLCIQNKGATEKLRQLRARIVKLEMENLKFYVKHPDEPVRSSEARPVSPLAASLEVKATETERLSSPKKDKKEKRDRRDISSKDDSASATTAADDDSDRSGSVMRRAVAASRKKVWRKRQEVFPVREDFSTYQLASTIKRLQDEIDRLKDDRQFDRTKAAEREQHLVSRVFNRNQILVDKLAEQDRLLARLMQMIEDRDCMHALAGPTSPTQLAQRQALHEDLEESRTLIRQSSVALREGQTPEPQAFDNLITRLRTLKRDGLRDVTPEEQELLDMINRQASQLRKIHQTVTELADHT
ncbi:hypothetical protein TGARI_227000 [Toxoplasma gondii ARI]|uniref:Uncharacterized protein n=1 Tax=Toxoplasma gondii ARI TaxID=1074872 RepID=A0A139XX99_TOXGO|nr:hypothetical protein TGARI_227000 [Toxoplasma gondii ARI]